MVASFERERERERVIATALYGDQKLIFNVIKRHKL
jgi:hypothetical protein